MGLPQRLQLLAHSTPRSRLAHVTLHAGAETGTLAGHSLQEVLLSELVHQNTIRCVWTSTTKAKPRGHQIMGCKPQVCCPIHNRYHGSTTPMCQLVLPGNLFNAILQHANSMIQYQHILNRGGCYCKDIRIERRCKQLPQ